MRIQIPVLALLVTLAHPGLGQTLNHTSHILCIAASAPLKAASLSVHSAVLSKHFQGPTRVLMLHQAENVVPRSFYSKSRGIFHSFELSPSSG